MKENKWEVGEDDEELFEYAMHPAQYEAYKSGKAKEDFLEDVAKRKQHTESDRDKQQRFVLFLDTQIKQDKRDSIHYQELPAAQLGIFTVLLVSILMGFTPKEAASLGIIGGADGPTARHS